MPTSTAYNPFAKEKALRDESSSWDTSTVQQAQSEDIPTIDLSQWLTTGSEQNLDIVANQLKVACEEVGFFSLIGHQIDSGFIADVFSEVKRFHNLPIEIKNTILMDKPDYPVKGIGYLPFKNVKLPSRDKGNLNEAFIIKRDHNIRLNHNMWPAEDSIVGFRQTIERYAERIENLALSLLPIYAKALELDRNFFNQAFTSPLYRLRMTHYPAIKPQAKNEYGIAPHVDTTFFTILVQDSPGLTIYSERRQCWIKVPMLNNAFIVNSGELLKQWTNDRFLSVKHFANNNTSATSRYSIPFFFNANSDYVMSCIPTCTDKENPPKYLPISYIQSQAVAQGE